MTFRKVWFITRPERDPKFHPEALTALKNATKNFTLNWSGNRKLHQEYEKELNRMGLKRDSISRDGSGGRTWAAMLKTFSYCYTDDEGFLVPTKAGISIINGVKVFENIKKQILTLQIPNAYFLESGFRPKFEPGFAVRPARFLIKLCNQPELDYYLTKEEITYFALTAKKDSDLPDVVQKIKQFREADEEKKQIIKQETAAVYDHRERSDRGARDFEGAHSDVAHTFMLICEFTELVEYIRGQALRVDPADSRKTAEEIQVYDERYPFNKRYLISLQRMAENSGLDVDSYKASSYGSIRPASNRRKTEIKVKQIMEQFPDPSSLTAEEIKEALESGFPPRDAEKIAFKLKKDESFASLNSGFVEAYLHEENNLAFEDKTGQILKAIGFDVVMRPKPNAPVSTEIEILLKYGGTCCGIIDAKNYKEKFLLSANYASHMASEYIPNYEGYDGCRVQFFGYITASNFGGANNLEKISKLAKRAVPDREIKGIMMSASVLLAFLDYCIEEDLSQEERTNLFLKAVNNTAYSSIGQLLKAVKNSK